MKKVMALLVAFLMILTTMSQFVFAIDKEEIKSTDDSGNLPIQTIGTDSVDVDISYDEAWSQEIAAYETSIGNMIDNVCSTNIYVTLATSTEESDRNQFVEKVINIYDQLSIDQKDALGSYLLGYAAGTNSKNVLDFLASQKSATKVTSLAGYNTTAAINYAYAYYSTYNLTDYPDVGALGGDCANFVSQCLYAGGKPMDSNWYIRKKNSTYPRPANATQLDYSWDVANPSPWISAREFSPYWSWNGADTTDLIRVGDYLNWSSKIIAGYGNGDAVQIMKRNIIAYYGYHTMLITGTRADYYYTAHTSSRKDYNLTTALGSYNSDEYMIKFYSMY